MAKDYVTIDGNEAAARVAYALNDVIAIYPITPSSPMGELADEWAAAGKKNLWGAVPQIVEMQSEAGAAGAVHGALQGGAMATTFTSSQGLLLMLPNLYKIAGELSSAVIHIAARSLASHALSIFGDHSDVMAARATGWGMLFASSVQEAADFALIAQAASLQSRIPFLHIFDGFRTSHEVKKIRPVTEEEIRSMISLEQVRAHRRRGLSPDQPVIRGTAQNPDVFFQARERQNLYYDSAPAIVEEAMDRFYRLVGRRYRPFDYEGHPEATRVVVLMGSGVGAVEETVRALVAAGEKVGMVKVRLFRPFSPKLFLDVLPKTTQIIAALDRTKEPGSAGEPLLQDVVTALVSEAGMSNRFENGLPRVIGGRYGLSSKEFTPAMVRAVFDEMAKDHPRNRFTVGIVDDLTHLSLPYDPDFRTENTDGLRAIFWGLGSDGTVSANKNAIKIIGEETENDAQGYFVYDSKKSGAVTISHLRFGPKPIIGSYEIQEADFVAVHHFPFLERYDVLEKARRGATFLLNSPYGPDEVWERLPASVRQTVVERNLAMYVIDAGTVAKEAGLGNRINTVMQACFFALSDVIPKDEAIAKIKAAIERSYGARGENVVRANFQAVDQALDHLKPVEVPTVEVVKDAFSSNGRYVYPTIGDDAPGFVRNVTAPLLAGLGEELPVSALPCDGTFPVGTARYEKRSIATEIPQWDPDICIQCGKCVLVCPHAAIRAKVYPEDELESAPEGFLSSPARWRGLDGHRYTLQVSPDDCTGCALCVEACPVPAKKAGHRPIEMTPKAPLREAEAANWDFFLKLPEVPKTNGFSFQTVKDVQLLQPLFEFSGACAGCGETPYLKLLSQLFGDRAVIANATGCSSIFGGNLPTTPWASNADGRGPAWSNSLFEDNAEFGLGIRLGLDEKERTARRLLKALAPRLGKKLVREILEARGKDEASIEAQRRKVAVIKERLISIAAKFEGEEDGEMAKDLLGIADMLVPKSVWIVGGDGWAYDIGFGGLDHVLASGYDVNVLVLDTEVYSNTGGQASKATPRGATARFAADGKAKAKKDLGLIAMQYGDVYVATVAMGADDAHTLKVMREAESYDGPSLIIAYSHCIAHGIDMQQGLEQQRLAERSGHWPLYRYHPERGFELRSKKPSLPLEEYMKGERRFRRLLQEDPEDANALINRAKEDVLERFAKYEQMASQS